MTGWTDPDQLPYPDDYNAPADVPTDMQALAESVQAALDTKPDKVGGAGASGTWPISISGNAATVDGQSFTFQDTATLYTYVWGLSTTGESKLIATNRFALASHTHTPAQAGVVGRVLGTTFTLAADATATYTVAHGLGKTPAAVIAQAYDDTGTQSIVMSVTSWDATNVVVLARNVGSASETFRITTIAV